MAVPEAQIVRFEAVAVPAALEVQLGGVSSSAPISGLVALRVAPSISMVIPAIGVPNASNGVVPWRCRLFTAINNGLTARELASWPVAVCQAASEFLALPKKPTALVTE